MGKFGIFITVIIAIFVYYGSQFVNIKYEMCRIIQAPLEDVFSFMYQTKNYPQIHPLV